MEDFRLLVFLVFLVVVSRCGGAEEAPPPECSEYMEDKLRLIEGEDVYFLPRELRENTQDFLLKGSSWTKQTQGDFKNGVSTDQRERVHHHRGALFFLNVTAEDSGTYNLRATDRSGECFHFPLIIKVYNSKDRKKTFYGKVDHSEPNKRVKCPPVPDLACRDLNGSYSWFKDGNLLHGESESFVMVNEATKEDEGEYTCTCTWTHNQRTYNSSGTRTMIVKERVFYDEIKILAPTNSEQFAEEGLGIRLNCSVFCGLNLKQDCDAKWRIKGEDLDQLDGYNQTIKMVTDETSKRTISDAVLHIRSVSAEDFRREFQCVGTGLYETKTLSLTLKRKESAVFLIVGGVCMLLVCLFCAVLIRCFAIDLALFFRPYLPLSSHDKDARVYDAYVVYQTQSLDKATEEKLACFVNNILPAVLEEKCGYRLFIQGRDDLPGEDRLVLVEERLNQSRRLMVILTPGSGSKSQITDKPTAPPQTSVMGGFDWQFGLHHALVQRGMNVILIQVGEAGAGGYGHLPPGLQHLVSESAPLRWPGGARAPGRSAFWKKVRYLMPVTPSQRTRKSCRGPLNFDPRPCV